MMGTSGREETKPALSCLQRLKVRSTYRLLFTFGATDMKARKLWSWMVLFASFALLVQFPNRAKAQDQQDQQVQPDQPDQQAQDDNDSTAQDPPGRVGRLNFSQGSVSFRPAGEDDWVTAVPNRPMVTGDDLWADENSRAEVHVGSAALRLGSKTGITFLALDDRTTQIRLAQGSLILRVRHVDDEDSYEVDTPNLAFSLLQPGVYRVDVSEDGSQTVTTVWHGRGRVTGGGLTYTVLANQSDTFTGNEQHLDYDIGQIRDRDDFDSWAFDRDDREDRADSANYVSREMTGYEDLDANGDWDYVAGYGECWRPRALVAGWAPYRFGHWAYVGPWGWTWVEDEPWGFAPFHYGRWAFVNSGWFWVPGPVVVRPVWAPALVAFVGGGPGFHFSAGVGVGWFPLAPGEVYVPGYHVSRGYVNNVNITNTTVNITKVTNVYNTVIVNRSTTVNNITYVNQRVNNGVTVVSHEAFVNARPVAQNVMHVDAREVASAPVGRMVAAEPVRASVLGSGRPVNVRPPAAVIKPSRGRRQNSSTVAASDRTTAGAGWRTSERTVVGSPGWTDSTRADEPGARPANTGWFPFVSARPIAGNNQVHQTTQGQPRVFEQQGNAEGQNRNGQNENQNVQAPQNRMQPTNRDFRGSQQQERSAQQETHPLVRQAPPVQQRTQQQEQQQEQKFNQWHQQRPSQPEPQPRQQQQSRPEPRQEKPPKK